MGLGRPGNQPMIRSAGQENIDLHAAQSSHTPVVIALYKCAAFEDGGAGWDAGCDGGMYGWPSQAVSSCS